MHAAAVAACSASRRAGAAEPRRALRAGLARRRRAHRAEPHGARRTDRTTPAELAAIFADLEARAGEWARRGGLPIEQITLSRSIEMRYARQNHELAVEVGRRLTPATLSRRFHRGAPACVRLRLARGADRAGDVPRGGDAAGRAPGDRRVVRTGRAARGSRPVYFESTKGFVETPVLERASPPRVSLAGPAVIEQIDCTTVVEPGQTAAVDATATS